MMTCCRSSTGAPVILKGFPGRVLTSMAETTHPTAPKKQVRPWMNFDVPVFLERAIEMYTNRLRFAKGENLTWVDAVMAHGEKGGDRNCGGGDPDAGAKELHTH